MKSLPHDIFRCLGGGCHDKDKCLRYLRRLDDFPNLSYIASGAFEEGVCIYKIEKEEE